MKTSDPESFVNEYPVKLHVRRGRLYWKAAFNTILELEECPDQEHLRRIEMFDKAQKLVERSITEYDIAIGFWAKTLLKCPAQGGYSAKLVCLTCLKELKSRREQMMDALIAIGILNDELCTVGKVFVVFGRAWHEELGKVIILAIFIYACTMLILGLCTLASAVFLSVMTLWWIDPVVTWLLSTVTNLLKNATVLAFGDPLDSKADKLVAELTAEEEIGTALTVAEKLHRTT